MNRARDRDSLETWPTPERPHYAEGVLLDAADFLAEQAYHRSRLARTLATLHGSGTVMGLKVGVDPAAAATPEARDRQQVVVEPGLAVDRVGRLVEVRRRSCLRFGRWLDQQGAPALADAFHRAVPVNDPPFDGETPEAVDGIVADVYLRFVACDVGRTPAFAVGPFDALDASQPSRVRDAFELTLRLAPEDDPTETLPRPPFAGDRAAVRRDLLEDAWQRLTDLDPEGRAPMPLPGHPDDQDPTAVFLARLVVRATRAGNGPVTRVADGAVACRNYARRFVHPGSALAHLAGL